MAHRTILTARQRATLFDLPTDEAGKGWGRRTTRLDGIVRHIGFALGGRPGHAPMQDNGTCLVSEQS